MCFFTWQYLKFLEWDWGHHRILKRVFWLVFAPMLIGPVKLKSLHTLSPAETCPIKHWPYLCIFWCFVAPGQSVKTELLVWRSEPTCFLFSSQNISILSSLNEKGNQALFSSKSLSVFFRKECTDWHRMHPEYMGQINISVSCWLQ